MSASHDHAPKTTVPDLHFSQIDVAKLEEKGCCVQSVRVLIRLYDKVAVGSGSFERVGDMAFVKESGISELVGDRVFHERDFADSE